MLFFRSEEQIERWCRTRDLPVRPRVRIDQLWGLATAWYSNRLKPDSRRPQPDEIRRIFSGLGLTESFWDPQADAFTR